MADVGVLVGISEAKYYVVPRPPQRQLFAGTERVGPTNSSENILKRAKETKSKHVMATKKTKKSLVRSRRRKGRRQIRMISLFITGSLRPRTTL